MTKIQKIWLGVSVLLFVVPEILFSFIVLSVVNFSKEIMSPLVYIFVNGQFFVDHSVYLFLAMFIELFGILSLLILNIILKNRFFIILFSILTLWLLFILYVSYIMANILSF